MAKIVTLREPWSSLSAAVWNNWGGGNCTVGTNRLTIRSSSTNSANYYGIDSQATYDLTDSQLTIEVVSLPTIAVNDNSLSMIPLSGQVDANNRVMWEYTNQGLKAILWRAGVETVIGTLTYAGATHKYLRIREQGGLIYWDYSTTGLTWINAFSNSYIGLTITALDIAMSVGAWQVTTGGQYSMVLGTVNIGLIEETFTWKGYSWQRRDFNTYGHGDPTYNYQWSRDHVMNPDANDRVVLRLSNPTGASPTAAEMRATTTDWGYGVYTVVCEGPLSSMHKSIVNGGLYLFDAPSPPAWREIDVHEASAWGETADPVYLAHNYWRVVNAAREVVKDDIAVPADLIQTHQLIWTPDHLEFNSYIGSGVNATPYFRTVVDATDIPTPGTERPHMNLWVFGGGDATESAAPAFEVTYHDFDFTPYTPGSLGWQRKIIQPSEWQPTTPTATRWTPQ